MVIDEALEGWLLHLRADNVSTRTLDRYARVWRQFGTWLAARDVTEVGQLRAEHLRLCVLGRLAQVSGVTAHYEVSPIKSLTAWLERTELVERDPFRNVRKPKVARHEMDILRPAEMKQLLAVFDHRQPHEFRDYVIVSLVLATGLRRSEIITARLEDLDGTRRSLVVMGKGRKQCRVPIPAEVAALLWRYVKTVRNRYARTHHLFVTRRGGPPSTDYVGSGWMVVGRRPDPPTRKGTRLRRHAVTARPAPISSDIPPERRTRASIVDR